MLLHQNQEKTTSKRVVQKTGDGTGNLTGNKITDKVTSASKTSKNTKEAQQNERQVIYIPPEKRQQIIDNLRLFLSLYKNGIPKK